MNYSVFRISLDIHESSSQTLLRVKKGDTHRRIYAVLTEDGKPYTISDECFAVFSAKKPEDANGERAVVFNACTVEGNRILYDITPQNTELVGMVDCEFKLYGTNEELITCPRFTMLVEDTVSGDQEVLVEGAKEVSALTKLVSMAQNLPDETTPFVRSIDQKLSEGDADSAVYMAGALTDDAREIPLGENSLSMGDNSVAGAKNSIAAGKGNVIGEGGDDSVVVGKRNENYAQSSIVNGEGNVNNEGASSLLSGENNNNSGNRAVMGGRCLINANEDIGVFGKYNKGIPGARLEVGSGTSEANRQSVFYATDNGAYVEKVDESNDYAVLNKKYVDDALVNLPSGNGGIYVGSGDMPDGYNVQIDPNGEAVDISEKWELIRDDTLTEDSQSVEITKDANGNNISLKKIKIIVFADTTQGVYTNAVIRYMIYAENGSLARAIYANNGLPTADGKFAKSVCDIEVLDGVAYAMVSFSNGLSSLTSYNDLGNPVQAFRNVGVPLRSENIEHFRIQANVPMHAGTRIVVWGVRA